jgi:hypothetical protein
MNIGLIQTRSMGDIAIAAPIAMYWPTYGEPVRWQLCLTRGGQFVARREYA